MALINTLKAALTQEGIDTSTFKKLISAGESSTYSLDLPASQTATVWRTFADLAPKTGFFPIILGTREEGAEYEEIELGDDVDEPEYALEILEEAAEIVPEEWLAELASLMIEENAEYASEGEEPMELPPHDEWSDIIEPSDDQLEILDEQEPDTLMRIAFVPTVHSYEAPAHLIFGEFNECPSPDAHVALLKYWCERYQGEVAVISPDTLEVFVRNPPTDRDSALHLAEQQYWYCPDIVDQGTGSVEALAGALLGGATWFFWWD